VTKEERQARARASSKVAYARHREERIAYQRAYYRANRDAILAQKKTRGHLTIDYHSHIRRKYSLTPDQYESLSREQNGRCAICNTLPRRRSRLHVDHDHATGLVRGLLCNQCNLGLGHFSDEVSRVAAAFRYLNNGGTIRERSETSH
jgi:hypothetical protein